MLHIKRFNYQNIFNSLYSKPCLCLVGFRSRWLPFPHWQQFVPVSASAVAELHPQPALLTADAAAAAAEYSNS